MDSYLNRRCPRCGRPLIHPLGARKPDYCWVCNREFRYLDTVKKQGDKK